MPRLAALAAIAVASAFALPATQAHAETVTVRVPAIFVYVNAPSPTIVDNCETVTFAQWADVPGTVGATVNYIASGAPGTKYGTPPFNDQWRSMLSLDAPAGSHWLSITDGRSLGNGAAQACAEMDQRQRAQLVVPPTVDLLVTRADPATITQIAGIAKLSRGRVAEVAKVACPVAGSCTVTVPRTVNVKLAGKTYVVTVVAPRTIAGGKTGIVRLSFTKAAAKAFAGRKLTPFVKVTAGNGNATPAVRTVKRAVSVPAAS